MMTASPLVSIIIPTFARPKLLERAIASCLSQTHDHVEVIVIDDCSPDDATAHVLRTWAERDDRVVTIANETNLGFIRNWNVGLERARGSYIKVMGDDDMLRPACIETQLAQLVAAGPRAGIVCCDYDTVDRDGDVVRPSKLRRSPYRLFRRDTIEDGNDFILGYLRRRRRVGLPAAILVAKSVVDDVGTFDELAGSMADIEYWARICSTRDFVYVDQRLCAQGRDENLSTSLATAPDFHRQLERLYRKLAGYVAPERRAAHENTWRFTMGVSMLRAARSQPRSTRREAAARLRVVASEMSVGVRRSLLVIGTRILLG